MPGGGSLEWQESSLGCCPSSEESLEAGRPVAMRAGIG